MKKKEKRVMKLERRIVETESRKDEVVIKEGEEEVTRKVKRMKWIIEKEERKKNSDKRSEVDRE